MCKKEEESISLPDSSFMLFFQTWKIIHWNSANVTIDAQMKNHVYIWASLPYGFRSNIKRSQQWTTVSVCQTLSPSVSFFIRRSLQIYSGLGRRRGLDSACCQTKALQCRQYYSDPVSAPQSYEITAMQCLPHIKSIHGLRKMLFCEWKGLLG